MTLLGASTMLAPTVCATHLTADQAFARLTQSKTPSRAMADYRLTETIGNLYIFSGEEGYVVLPADDAAPALLGYSESNKFEADINPNLKYWLNNLNAEIEYMASNYQTSAARTVSTQRDPIAPMTTTRWNQEWPYNDDCPMVGDRHCVTGCVATAMAQLLKYHNHPAKGTGEATYRWNGRDLTFDYGNTTFDWDDMTDVYDSSSSAKAKQAVAQLMFACGVSVKMEYDVDESAASSQNVPGALITHFNYDRSVWLAQRNAYGIDEWEDLIYNELKENRPVMYSGAGDGGGHEFICDGYSENGYFHFNWGWGGMSDGYFLLTALNPTSLGIGGGAGGYNFDQTAVIGAQPAKEGSLPTYVMYNISDFTPGSETGRKGEEIEFKGGFINYGAETIDDLHMGIKLQRVGGNDAIYSSTEYEINDLRPIYYFNAFHVRIPADLTDGDHIITPAYSVEGRAWQDMRSYMNVTGMVFAKVEGNNVAFTVPVKETVSVTDVDVLSDVYIGRTAALSYTVTNPGDREFLGEVIPCLIDAEGVVIAKADPIPVDLMGGESHKYESIATSFKAEKDEEFKAGTYRLIFRDGTDSNISEPKEIIVKEVPEGETIIDVKEFALMDETPVRDKKSVKFHIDVECKAGYFSGPLRVIVFPYEYGDVSSVGAWDSPYIYLGEGQSVSKTFDIDLSRLKNGKYFAILYSGSHQASDKEIVFELMDDSDTSIEEITPDTESEEIIYDLNGVRHAGPLLRGIYIINGVKTIVR